MTTTQDVSAAICTFQTIAHQLESAKSLICNQHSYFSKATELASTQEERLVLLGAYLATKNLMEDTGQSLQIMLLATDIAPEIVEKANLPFHFSQ